MSETIAPGVWPTELVFRRSQRRLDIAFDDGVTASIPFERLRVESPSAEVRGHGGARPPRVMGKEHVGVVDAKAVGRYAVRIIFDDGHDSGIFSWDYLRELGKK